MRRTRAAILLLFATSLFAQGKGQVVRWSEIAGLITAPGMSNLVAGIPNGALPWTTSGGQAAVNLSTDDVAFNVRGLVLNGGDSTGTTGGITQVKGTLICNPNSDSRFVLDTPAVPLSPEGDAQFAGKVASIPASCASPLFLIRISSAPDSPVNNHWIATGAVRTFSQR
jgi:hypothetical protein